MTHGACWARAFKPAWTVRARLRQAGTLHPNQLQGLEEAGVARRISHRDSPPCLPTLSAGQGSPGCLWCRLLQRRDASRALLATARALPLWAKAQVHCSLEPEAQPRAGSEQTVSERRLVGMASVKYS